MVACSPSPHPLYKFHRLEPPNPPNKSNPYLKIGPLFPIMSSIGASCAQIYVMKKRQKENMKKMEEERVRRGESSVEERKAGSSTVGMSKKVHPGYFPSQDSAGKPGETCHNVS